MKPAHERLTASLADRYTIERELGQGGMATVYLATDVRHDRKVALKVMRPELSAVIGADRFLAEIKTTAQLQHPHILPLHDSGEADGTVFYVMPFVAGESLRERLKRDKQLPVDEAVRIAREVASALDYAHRHGVVHRDIKPENILLHDGQALVADFGIALAVSRSDSNTRMTETGMSLGTPHYMAPEQAMGEREITQKADIYAIGAVLYEMLTGDPPFTGSTAQAIVARAVTESPRGITIQRHTVPPHIEAAVLTALEKLPADRYATAGEFAAALENPSASRRAQAHAGSAAASAPQRDWRTRAALPALAVAAVAVAVAVLALNPGDSDPATPATRYALAFPSAALPSISRAFEVSPTGSHFAYFGPGEGGGLQIWLKSRDRANATPLAGTGGTTRMAFAPDGESLVFVQGTQVRKVAVVGGAAVPVADSAANARGVAWLEDGSIVYVMGTPRLGAELRRVSSTGGTPEVIWSMGDSAIGSAWNPSPLPGSRGVLFTQCAGACVNAGELWVLDLRSGESKRVIAGAIAGYYVPTGHIVYVRPDGGLLALPFDLGSLEPRGTPIPVRDSVARGFNNMPLFAVSQSGTMFVRAGGSVSPSEVYELVWVDRTGNETTVDPSFRFRLTVQGENRGWSLSPEGRRLAIGLNTEAGDDVWVKQLPNGPASRVTFDTLPEHRPRWSVDGQKITFLRYTNRGELYRRSADGTGADEALLPGMRDGVYEAAASPDGQYLVVRTGGQQNVTGGRDISVVRVGEDSVPRPLVASSQFDESTITLSPDGKWLAYESTETNASEVYLVPFPNVDGGKWQVSTGGGRAPVWARNSRELFYVNGAREMVVVPVTFGGPAPVFGARAPLFRIRDDLYLADLERYTPFDISPDGRRFIMARRVAVQEAQVVPIVVTENWFDELRRVVGGR